MTQGSGKRWSSWRCAFLLALGCSVTGLVAAQEDISGVVTEITDGDALVVKPRARKPIKVRISGVDAPEICQTGGSAAKAALVRRLDHRTVLVESAGRDTYGRTLGRVLLNGQDVGEWLVSEGLAWNYRGPYAQEERDARANRLGVHAQRGAIRPSEFRQRNGSCAGADLAPSSRPKASLDDFTLGTTTVRSANLSSDLNDGASRTSLQRQEARERELRLKTLRESELRKQRQEKLRQAQLLRERQQRLRDNGNVDQFDTQGFSTSDADTSNSRKGSLRY
jgi:micrococcal nuclease